MKCINCNSGEYQTVENIKIQGKSYERQYCSNCDDEHFLELSTKTHKRTHYKFNKSKFTNFVVATTTVFAISGITYLVSTNLDKFTTVYR